MPLRVSMQEMSYRISRGVAQTPDGEVEIVSTVWTCPRSGDQVEWSIPAQMAAGFVRDLTTLMRAQLPEAPGEHPLLDPNGHPFADQ